MTCDFTSFLTVFQSYQDNGWLNERLCAMKLSLLRFAIEIYENSEHSDQSEHARCHINGIIYPVDYTMRRSRLGICGLFKRIGTTLIDLNPLHTGRLFQCNVLDESVVILGVYFVAFIL